MEKADNLIVTDRGGVVENTHQVHVAVVDHEGKLLFYIGNPHRITLLRSAAKPIQALAAVETGCFEKGGFDEADLALMCASHNSEDQHIKRARAMLLKADIKEEDLRCGGHPSINPDLNRQWIQEGFMPTRVYNNCSGKHAGMIAAAKAIHAPIEDYHLLKHPIQLMVKSATEQVAGLKPEEVKWGIDGCNMPAPAFSLDRLAKTYASFAQAADEAEIGNENQISSQRQKWMARIFRAMSDYPEMVGGTGRFCTILMKAYRGQLFGKVGADACYGIGIRASEDTRRLGVNGSVGIAVKISDGNLDILYASLVEILTQLGIGTPETRQALVSFREPELRNTMGVVTGRVTCTFKLRPA